MKKSHILKDIAILNQIGLTEREAAIYLAAIDTGGGTVSELAKEAEIERTGIYYHINNLISDGLLTVAARGKRTTYLPVDPDKLHQLWERKHNNLESILPRLQEQFSREAGHTIVEYFQGIEDVNKFYDRLYAILQEMTPPENTLYILGQSFKSVTSHNKEFLKFIAPKEQLNIVTKVILNESQRRKDGDAGIRDPYIATRYNLPAAKIRYISDRFNYPSAVVIMGNKIALIDYRNFIYSIHENKNMATTWKLFFDFIWEHLKS